MVLNIVIEVKYELIEMLTNLYVLSKLGVFNLEGEKFIKKYCWSLFVQTRRPERCK